MCRPYNALGGLGVALVVDLAPAVVHRPGPGALDDPAPRQNLKASRRDAVDDLDGDAEPPAHSGRGSASSLSHTTSSNVSSISLVTERTASARADHPTLAAACRNSCPHPVILPDWATSPRR